MASHSEFIERVNKRNEIGWTVVRNAVANDPSQIEPIMQQVTHDEWFELLSARDKSGWTVMHAAASGQTSSEVIRKMLDFLSSTHRHILLLEKDNAGKTVIHLAAARQDSQDKKVLKCFLEAVAASERLRLLLQKDDNGKTAIHEVAEFRDVVAMQIMLESITDTERYQLLCKKDKSGCTALHSAINCGPSVLSSVPKTKILPLLFKNNFAGMTPMQMATAETILAIIKNMDFEERLQGLCERNAQGLTGLHTIATSMIDHSVLSFVFSDLNVGQKFECLKQQSNDGQTVLHILAARSDIRSETIIGVVKMSGRNAKTFLELTDNNMKTAADVSALPDIKSILTLKAGMHYLHRNPTALIFYNTNEAVLQFYREDAEVEAESIATSLTNIGYGVKVFREWSGEHVLQEISAQKSEDLSALVVVFMCHGTTGILYDKDMNPISIQQIITALDDPALNELPKVLIIQACQTNSVLKSSLPTGTVTTTSPSQGDSNSCDATPIEHSTDTFHIREREFLIISTTLYGCPAQRNHFIPKISRRIDNSTNDDDWEELVKIVNEEMKIHSFKQIPLVESTLTRRLSIRQFLA